MRGKLLIAPRLPALVRITPAHAGKTGSAASSPPDFGDHPRACGENFVVQFKSGHIAGSPPRMRGKRVKTAAGKNRIGITPAHAGKTSMCRNTLQGIRDHPRACGENTVSPISSAARRGSPPRMRGKRISISKMIAQGGITPAHAGKTIQEE